MIKLILRFTVKTQLNISKISSFWICQYGIIIQYSISHNFNSYHNFSQYFMSYYDHRSCFSIFLMIICHINLRLVEFRSYSDNGSYFDFSFHVINSTFSLIFNFCIMICNFYIIVMYKPTFFWVKFAFILTFAFWHHLDV